MKAPYVKKNMPTNTLYNATIIDVPEQNKTTESFLESTFIYLL